MLSLPQPDHVEGVEGTDDVFRSDTCPIGKLFHRQVLSVVLEKGKQNVCPVATIAQLAQIR